MMERVLQAHSISPSSTAANLLETMSLRSAGRCASIVDTWSTSDGQALETSSRTDNSRRRSPRREKGKAAQRETDLQLSPNGAGKVRTRLQGPCAGLVLEQCKGK